MYRVGSRPVGCAQPSTPRILGSEGPVELGSSRDRLSGGSSLPLSLFPPSEPHFGSLLASLLESGGITITG
jgi:hypothetical protein